MNNKNTESIALEVPTPDESGVRLSSRPPAEDLRQKLAGLLNGRFPGMYALSAKTHAHFDLVDYSESEGRRVPRFPSPLQVASSFSDHALRAAQSYQKPALILAPPGRGWQELFASIDQYHQQGVRTGPAILDQNYLNWPPEDQYRAYIVEAASKMQPNPDDSLASPLNERLAHKLANKHPEEWGMSQDLYALLAMQSIVRGKMIDAQTFTILDAEPAVANRYFPIGHCRDGRPTLDWVPSEVAHSGRGRFRRVLGGRNPIEII